MPPKRTELPDLSRLTAPHRQLVAELGHLRALTGAALRPFGAKAGLSFTRVRRIENGEMVPSLPEVESWARAAGADNATLERLDELARRAHMHTSQWVDHLASGHLNHLAEKWEETARLVTSYQQAIIPGLVQTASYTRALIPHLRVPPGFQPDAHLAAQARRQDRLYDAERQFRFVLSRRAWSWSPDPQSDVMAGQHDRLRQAADLPNVGIRVLDDDASPMGAYANFVLYDEPVDVPPLVILEIEGGKTELNELNDVEHYRRRFGQLWDAARAVDGGR